jgi:hypothetical protein
MYGMWRYQGTSNLDFYSQIVISEGLGELIDLASYPKACFGVLRGDDGLSRGLIIAHKWNPSSSAYDNYQYKLILEEEMGRWTSSELYRAPKRILDQLSELDSLGYQELDGASRWRKNSKQWNQAQAAKPKPKKGQLVVFEKPYMISGVREDTFEFLGNSSFRVEADQSGQVWRLISWRRRNFSVEEARPDDDQDLLAELLG